MKTSAEHRVTVGTGETAYEVHIGPAMLERVGELLFRTGLRGFPRIVADRTVWGLHGDRLLAAFQTRPAVLEIDAGEDRKTLASVSAIYDWLVEQRAERGDPIIAFGGGVAGDMVGFVAATYLRGVPLVQVPTTMLAQVDSSVGGKTGVDHPRGKNLIGAFYDARLVVSDTDTLTTLPRRELAAGLAEVVKMAAILDARFFERLEADADRLHDADLAALSAAIARSVELKGEVVTSDHRESGLRMILNYGHTVGHAVEAATAYQRYLHGEAVSIGMQASATMAREMEFLSSEDAERQRQLLDRLDLPSHSDLAPSALAPALRLDKKTRQGRINWVLLRGLGHAMVTADVPDRAVERALDEVCRSESPSARQARS